MLKNKSLQLLSLFTICFVLVTGELLAHSANKVWMELRANGRFRVWLNYTVPELKEKRESYVEFSSKKEAEKFFFDIVRGADFFSGDASARSFRNQELLKSVPW